MGAMGAMGMVGPVRTDRRWCVVADFFRRYGRKWHGGTKMKFKGVSN